MANSYLAILRPVKQIARRSSCGRIEKFHQRLPQNTGLAAGITKHFEPAIERISHGIVFAFSGRMHQLPNPKFCTTSERTHNCKAQAWPRNKDKPASENPARFTAARLANLVGDTGLLCRDMVETLTQGDGMSGRAPTVA